MSHGFMQLVGRYARIAAVAGFTVAPTALAADAGLMIGWGANDYGQCNPPSDMDYTEITAGWQCSAAIQTNGTVRASCQSVI